jgi:pyrimidine-specific ribonucleoside hydrolase
MDRIPIIMDVDTGIDDAFALMLAGSSDNLEILAVTTCFGNRPLSETTLNTQKICELLGLDIPVAAGAKKGLIASAGDLEPLKSPRVHGRDGLGDMGYLMPPPTKEVEPMAAVALMAEKVAGCDRPVTLVPTGPLTNIAAFVLAHPELHGRVEKIVMMGGAVFGGNAALTAEANIYHDPEAAQIVMASGLRIVMCGLEATQMVYATKADRRRFEKAQNRISDVLCKTLYAYAGWYEEKMGYPGVVLHDSVPIAFLLKPTVLKTRPYHVAVDLDGRYTRGCTVTDTRLESTRRANVAVAYSADRQEIIEMHIEALKKYGN